LGISNILVGCGKKLLNRLAGGGDALSDRIKRRRRRSQDRLKRLVARGDMTSGTDINQSIINPTFTRRIEEKASERRSGFSLECFASCAWTKRPCF
jgi:hypothetical protein